jgi:hypothetical protein
MTTNIITVDVRFIADATIRFPESAFIDWAKANGHSVEGEGRTNALQDFIQQFGYVNSRLREFDGVCQIQEVLERD